MKKKSGMDVWMGWTETELICALPDTWPKEWCDWGTLCNLIALSFLEKNERIITGGRWREPSIEDTLTYCLLIKPQPSTLTRGVSSSGIQEHLQYVLACAFQSPIQSPDHILNIWLERQNAVTFPVLGLTAASIKLPRQLIQWSDLIIRATVNSRQGQFMQRPWPAL